jgi:hypothetical protein
VSTSSPHEAQRNAEIFETLDYAALHPGYGTDSLADDYKDVIGRIESGTEIETQ